MRRRTRRPSRPAGPRHALVWLVDGPGADALQRFREHHDPLAATLPPHVTLVFPFESTLTALQVVTHARRIVARWPAIPLSLQGVGAYQAEWVHVRVTRGREPIVQLHDRLYRRPLAPFLRTEFAYEPHVTIGRAADEVACERMIDEAKRTFTRPLDAIMRGLARVEVRPDGSVTIGEDIPFGHA